MDCSFERFASFSVFLSCSDNLYHWRATLPISSTFKDAFTVARSAVVSIAFNANLVTDLVAKDFKVGILCSMHEHC